MTARAVPVITNRLRLLILIAAHNAETAVAPVLDRLPAAVLADHDCAVLAINDAFQDSTFRHPCAKLHNDLFLTVVPNKSNHGKEVTRMSDTPTRYRKVKTSSLSFTATVSTRQRNISICWRPRSHCPRMRYSAAGCPCEAHLNAVARLCPS